MRPTQALHEAGQSLWLDNITRALLTSGKLAKMTRAVRVTRSLSVGPVLEASVPRAQIAPSSR